MKKVLSTKTLEPNAMAYAQTLGLDVTCVDFIETTALPFTLENIDPTTFNAIAFTSANAVKFFFENSVAASITQGKQIFALQGKTANELLLQSISPNITAASANELADIIVAANFTGTVLHVCGNLKLAVLANKLNEAGIAYQALIVYQTITKAEKLVGSFDAILFYSPSGVESFLIQNDIADNIICGCIGSTTAEALKDKKPAAKIILSAEPSQISMLSTIASNLHTHTKNHNSN